MIDLTQLVNGIPLFDIIGLLLILALIALALLWRVGRPVEWRRGTTRATRADRKARWLR